MDITPTVNSFRRMTVQQELLQTIDIYQYNTDSGFGTGPLDDTCYVNFRSGMAKEAESTPNTSTSSSSN